MKILRFEDLEVWSLARELNKYVYKITQEEQFSRDFRFKDQIRASSGSVSDNIAEGFERGGNKEFIQFLWIAKGSCGETRNQSYRAFDCSYITNDELTVLLEKTDKISRKIVNLINSIKNSEMKGPKYH